jgi:hypothetical protein
MPESAHHTITYVDYNGEKSSVKFRTVPIDGAAVDWDAEEAKRTAVATAISNITLGLLASDAFVQGNVVSLLSAASNAAQREKKWLVQYHDTVTLRRFVMEIPCADTSKLDPDDRANAHIGDGLVVDAFVSAFQANAKTPDGGTPIVDEITFVGRNV